MGLSCGMSMVKYGLFIFNLICAVAGIALIVAGALPLFKLQDIQEVFPENNPEVMPIIVLTLGCVIFVISFLGCCGAIRESQCMINMYAFFLLVLVVGNVVIAVYAFLYTKELAQVAEDGFGTLWNNSIGVNADTKYTAAIDGIQRALQCCGRQGPGDWGARIPPSCCADESSCNLASAFPKGCGQLLNDFVSMSGVLIAWVAVSAAAFGLLGVIFACCLSNSIRNSYRRSYA